MERNIPHVLDVFTCSPRARRRAYATDVDQVAAPVKDTEQKNPSSDSAVSVSSSDDEVTISKYFDYLNEDDVETGSASRRKKKKKGKENNQQVKETPGKENQDNNNKGKDKKEEQDERASRKGQYEKDIRHIERHLSMKKTIRKKMMRDLQQAFVEDPGEFQQDPNRMTPEKKNNINIRNLTFSKGGLSKSEHNFLDMLKDENVKEKKERKGFLGYRDLISSNKNKDSAGTVMKDDDSGHGSPSRDSPSKAASKEDLMETKEAPKEEKKVGFWKKLTGKGKSKR